MEPRYPIYVISKGRWESRLTVKYLEKMNVEFSLVIEPQEYERYSAVVDPKKILKLPFSDLGQGSIPARNWVWDHAVSRGTARHWIIDDNIRYFLYLNKNQYILATSGTIFRLAEDFVDRYENVGIAGFQYFMFAPRKAKLDPFALNTRVYSCILLRNDLPYRWRGRYNEDTDLSLRALKDGWCTMLFYAFICDKIATMRMVGGNTDELYKDDGRRKMAESLREQHPDVTRIVWKWNRWQHSVDYSGFKQKLIPKAGWEDIPAGINMHGLVLKEDGREEEDTDSGAGAVA